MKTLKFLIEKEFKQILRSKMVMGLILLFPVMTMWIFPWAIDYEVKDIRVNVVDESQGTYSQRLIQKIDASKYFRINATLPDYTTAYRGIETADCDIILQIPPAFDRDLIKTRSSSVMLSANAVDGTRGMLANNYLMQVVNDFSSELRAGQVAALALFPQASLPVIHIQSRYKFNERLEYKYYMIPAFMVILLTLICGILPAINIVGEKEQGTIQQINVTPVQKFSFILAKLIPYWIIGIIVETIAIICTWSIYGMVPQGNILLVYLLSFVYIVSISGLGIVVSNYSETTQQASFLIMFFILIIYLLSGMFTPVSSMPYWAQIIAYCNPLTYFVQVLRLLYLNGSRFADIAQSTGIILIFGIILNLWAVISYKKRT
ncbi:ABC transporter permease [Limibacterium fermenti]|uniref:ABC transporter permease n=1 Tax=Limibacterium fermenti TaxID=3229863 RepID=UPI000E92FACB|nr:ABC transporter permease [Porphyromonadaceae bacterium]